MLVACLLSSDPRLWGQVRRHGDTLQWLAMEHTTCQIHRNLQDFISPDWNPVSSWFSDYWPYCYEVTETTLTIHWAVDYSRDRSSTEKTENILLPQDLTKMQLNQLGQGFELTHREPDLFFFCSGPAPGWSRTPTPQSASPICRNPSSQLLQGVAYGWHNPQSVQLQIVSGVSVRYPYFCTIVKTTTPVLVLQQELPYVL